MVTQHYRWDFIGLSSYDKPTPETSEKVVDGSTYYEADTSKLYIFYKDTWYEKTATGGGGGGDITVVQTTGESTTDVMSQKATTSMVFADPATQNKIKIGYNAGFNGNYGIVIGSSSYNADSALRNISIGFNTHSDQPNSYDAISIGGFSSAKGNSSISIGRSAVTSANKSGSVALGAYSSATEQGEVNIGSSETSYGYNGTNYRLISGVHDGQNAQDAVTVNQVNATIDAINTALSTNIPHIGA